MQGDEDSSSGEYIFDTKSLSSIEMIKQSISIRIDEVINWDKMVWKAVNCGDENLLVKSLPFFLEEWKGLYMLSREFLKNKENKEEYDEFQLKPFIFDLKTMKVDWRRSALRAIKLQDKFFTDLKVSGLLDLRFFQLKKDQAYRGSI